VLHLAHPRVEFSDRGKSSIVLSGDDDGQIAGHEDEDEIGEDDGEESDGADDD